MKAKGKKPVERRPRSRADVFSASGPNLVGAELCQLILQVRDKLKDFKEPEERERLREELRDADLAPELTEDEGIRLDDIFRGVVALRTLLPMIYVTIFDVMWELPKAPDTPKNKPRFARPVS
ncbi:hypothetical protein J8F10_24495 [Gemmata sp. G18]|uniref:Uncharacterized protein n=1 Tax=Gemmata palustris TaxID=2822762 RepID=A0ABS5BXI4_9BACT|nr:hypothetical protein [Gemmata palustris]MBP3958421.1 hypothetical protein [Gemmata palustris]